MSTMRAHWAARTTEGRWVGGRLEVSSATDVEQLMTAIAQPLAEAAIIYHGGRPMIRNPFFEDGEDVPDHEVEVGVRDGWGYIRMSTSDDDDIWNLDGDPASPQYVQGESEFPAGSGLPLAQVSAALNAFLLTARRPECVPWVADHEWAQARDGAVEPGRVARARAWL